MTTRKQVQKLATIHKSEEAIRHERDGRNAIAAALDWEDRGTCQYIEEESGIELEFSDGMGIHRPPFLSDEWKACRERRATNTECAVTEFSYHSTTTIDVRKPVPQQVAKWLRREAARMLKAADKIEAIEDIRDLKTIRALVAGKLAIVSEPKTGDDEYTYEPVPNKRKADV